MCGQQRDVSQLRGIEKETVWGQVIGRKRYCAAEIVDEIQVKDVASSRKTFSCVHFCVVIDAQKGDLTVGDVS